MDPTLAADTPLGRWLARALGERRLTRSRTLSGGFRNANTMLVTEDDQRFVLRRYRDGDRCPVESALAHRLAGIAPVPEVVAADPTGEAAAEPVLLSRFAAGTPVSELLPGLPPAQAAGLGEAVGVSLAHVGTVSFARAGFFTGADLMPEPMVGMTLPEFASRCLAQRHPDHALSDQECAGVEALAARSAHLAATADDAHQLVHADFNPKNMLAQRSGAGWEVTALLDWEFAFSGSPLVDIGNLLRFRDDHPVGFNDRFVAGFAAAGGHLPSRWEDVSRALDLYALCEFLTRPASAVSRRAAGLLRDRAAAS